MPAFKQLFKIKPAGLSFPAGGIKGKKAWLWLPLLSAFCAGLSLSKSYGEEYSLEQHSLAKSSGSCWTGYISVSYDNLEDYLMACEGIRRAEEFLTNHSSYILKEPVSIIIREPETLKGERLREAMGKHFGAYIYKQGVIFMKPWSALTREKYLGMFPVTRELYRSFIAHEILHHFHYTQAQSARVEYRALDTEFLAAIAQLEAMAEPERSKMLKRLKQLWPSADESSVSLTVYMAKTDLFLAASLDMYLAKPDIFSDIFHGKAFLVDGWGFSNIRRSKTDKSPR